VPLTLNAGANDTSLSWYWRHNGSLDSTVSVNTGGVYQVEVKHNCGRSYDSIQVSHTNPPKLVLNDTSICLNDSVLITAFANSARFRWTTGDTTASVWIKDYKTYGVGAVNRCGADSTVFILSELKPPSLSFPNDTVICDNEVWLLNVIHPRSSYLWDNGDQQAVRSISLAGNYAVTVTNACGSNSKTVKVSTLKTPLAQIAVSPTGRYCPGTPITLTGSSLTDNGTSSWNTGDSSTSIVVTRGGNYTLTISNFCGSNSKTSTPNYYPLQAAFTLNKNEGMIPLDLEGTNQSQHATSYVWLLDSTVISDEFNLRYRVTPFGKHHIYLIAKDEFGCSDTTSDTVMVLQNPNIPPLLCDFRIDPNPAQDHFVISALNNDKQVRQIKIFDELGQIVLSSDISHWKENPFYFEHQFNNLATGTYLIGLYCEDETTFKKLVVTE